MKKGKSVDKSEGKETGEQKSTIQTPTTPATQHIRILYAGSCPKLTARGRGDLAYEIGINEASGDSYIRITGNVSSGAFSNEWLALQEIRTLLESATKDQKTFSAVTMESLFRRRSANNYGYLAAVLKAEGILTILPGKPVMLTIGEWEPVLNKIKTLHAEGINLTDHIAIANQQKAEKRAQLIANMKTSKSTKSTKEADTSKDQQEDISQEEDSDS